MTKFLGSYPDLGNGGARILHPDSQGVDLTLADALAVAGAATFAGGITVSGGGVSITGGGDISVDDITADDATFDDVTIDELILTLLKLGTNPSSTGLIRLANNQLIKARNAANNADLTLLGTDGSNNLLLGSGLTGLVKASSSVISAATLVNADVSASAAIAYSKLALALSIVNGDISASAAIAWSKIATSGAVVNADVSSSAAITPDKLSGPLFSYYRNSSSNNVTGNGTVYTCLFDTAVISNANYNTSTGIFTAPAAGKYLFVGKVGVASGSSGGTQGEVNVVTTGRSYRHDGNPYGNRHTASGVTSIPFAIIASMAQNDTAKVTLTVTGDGSNIADFIGGAFSDFAGWRVG